MSAIFTALQRLGAPITICAACGDVMRTEGSAAAGVLTFQQDSKRVLLWFCSDACRNKLCRNNNIEFT